LYECDHTYEEETIWITVSNDGELTLYEVTSEKAPGEMYGMKHVLDRNNTEKLLDRIYRNGSSDAKNLLRAFGGMDAVHRFKSFCDENDIQFTSYSY
jgi:hypothetical protein